MFRYVIIKVKSCFTILSSLNVIQENPKWISIYGMFSKEMIGISLHHGYGRSMCKSNSCVGV